MTSQRLAQWRWWGAWVLANAWSELLGLGLVASAGTLLARFTSAPRAPAAVILLALLFVALGAFEGWIVGMAQQRVLRRRLPALQGWVAATMLGAIVAWLLGMVPSTVMNLRPHDASARPPEIGPWLRWLGAAGMGLVTGPVLGYFQWRRLRLQLQRHAWCWLPANGLAWAVGMPVIFAAAHVAATASSPLAIAATVALALGLAGALVGAVHGAVLVWMLGAGTAAPREAGPISHAGH